MAQKISRREFAKRAAVAAGAVGLPALSFSDPNPQEATVESLEKQLSGPLSESTRKLTAEAIKAVKSQTDARLKHKLPEGSEPCTTYIPTGVKR